MRAVTTWTLIVLIVSCPLFCAADVCDSRAYQDCVADGSGCEPTAPGSCPNDSGNCVGEGAILPLICRSHDIASASPPLPCDGASAAPGDGLLIHRVHLSHRGRLADPTEPGGALSVCAWLEDFRC